MRARIEPWGAWIRLGQEAPTEPVDLRGALVALDRNGARRLGLEGGERWSDIAARSAPLEVHVAVTSRCAAGCSGCYQDATKEGAHVSRVDLERTLDALRDAEVFTVAFGGGEPILRDDLGELARSARERGLTPVVTTSGLGLTEERARALREFAQVNVSYDGAGEGYRAVRGFDGGDHAERAIAMLVREGIRVGVNVVLTRATFGRTRATLERAAALGAVEAQLLRYKPAGRAAALDYYARRLEPDQIAAFPALLRELEAWRHRQPPPFALRIDCALVCFLSGDPELAADPARLARSGVFGCEAGHSLAAVTASGRVAPCSFAGATDAEPRALRRLDLVPTIADLDAFANAPPEPCASCTLRDSCRGGCRIVAGFSERSHTRPFALAPDPECPRVRAHRAGVMT